MRTQYFKKISKITKYKLKKKFIWHEKKISPSETRNAISFLSTYAAVNFSSLLLDPAMHIFNCF